MAPNPDPATTASCASRSDHAERDPPRRPGTEGAHVPVSSIRERGRAALDAGGDPAAIAGWISETSATRAAAAATADLGAPHPRRLTEDQIAAIVEGPGELLDVLRRADPRDKAALYNRIGRGCPTNRAQKH